MDFGKGFDGMHKGIEGAGLVRLPGQVLDNSPGVLAEHGDRAP